MQTKCCDKEFQVVLFLLYRVLLAFKSVENPEQPIGQNFHVALFIMLLQIFVTLSTVCIKLY